MRTARLTWQGALHHVMNRGINKLKIFLDEDLKEKYIKLMAEKSEKFNIKIFAFCIMDNHFHIALENSSGKLSDFMRCLNGQYGQFYRKATNSKGYVFEDRFKSTLIQDESYLTSLIIYILQNPVRSGYLKNPYEYPWSSVFKYYNDKNDSFVNTRLVEDFFLSRESFENSINNQILDNLDEQTIGNQKFYGDSLTIPKLNEIVKKSNINFPKNVVTETLEKLIYEFEVSTNKKLYMINLNSENGKKLRRLFLFKLREKGFTYKDIHKIDIFKDLNINSLRVMFYLEKNCK